MRDWELHARTNALDSRITREVSTAERNALEAAQQRADNVAAFHGERAHAPMPGETSLEYRRRLLGKFQKHSPQFRHSRFDFMDAATIGAVEEIVFHDAVEAGKTRAAPGKLVELKHRDAAGREITKHYGDIAAFIAPFTRRGVAGKFNAKPGG